MWYKGNFENLVNLSFHENKISFFNNKNKSEIVYILDNKNFRKIKERENARVLACHVIKKCLGKPYDIAFSIYCDLVSIQYQYEFNKCIDFEESERYYGKHNYIVRDGIICQNNNSYHYAKVGSKTTNKQYNKNKQKEVDRNKRLLIKKNRLILDSILVERKTK